MANISKKENTSNDATKSVNELLANVTDFIDSVYRDILSPTSRRSLNSSTTTPSPSVRRSLSSSLSSPDDESKDETASGHASETAGGTTTLTGLRTRRSMEADIERINRICDTVDLNLRSIGLLVNAGQGNRCFSNSSQDRNDEFTFATPPRRASTNSNNGGASRAARRGTRPTGRARPTVITEDLNERISPATEPIHDNSTLSNLTEDDDDEVVVVSCNLPTVIDLCTPNNEEPRRAAVVNRNELTRRSLASSQDDNVVPIRRRRVSKSSLPLTIDDESDVDNHHNTSASDAGNTSQRTPFMCPVCMESCIQRRPTSTKCGHVFCEVCIKQAVRLTRKCPICNTKVNSAQLFRIYV